MSVIKYSFLSVLMPVYNTEMYVAEAVESILNQSFQEFEFVILDDGSTDRSLEILKRYEKLDSRIRLISRENMGVSKTRNELMSEAQAELVVWADSDDISYPFRIERLLDMFQSSDELIMLSSSFRLVDASGWPISVMKDPGSYGIGSSAFLKRAAMDIGGFRNDFRVGEDTDLGIRMKEVGKTGFIEEPLLDYRQHFDSVCNSLRLAVKMYAERIKMLSDDRITNGKDLLQRGENFANRIPREKHSPEPEWQTHTRWAWWALGAGNVMTARKHAFFAVQKNPMSKNTWKVFACSIRGY